MSRPTPTAGASRRARTPRAALAVAAVALAAIVTAVPAAAAPPEPAGPHPRLFLDEATVAALEAAAARPGSAVARAITRCERIHADPSRYTDGGFQGLYFAENFGACAVAWVATRDPVHGAEAVRFFRVLVDDYQTVGDGAGGDDVVRHDSGFAMRAFAPYTAIAYDWLRDAPGVDDALLARARRRFKAWTDWYPEGGYNADQPGSNYQAGYLFGAALIAVAWGGEGGADSRALWERVVDQVFGVEMAAHLVPGGRLDGGDWLEGWQYGNLSVIEYAAAARALRDNGVPLVGYAAWEGALVARALHASVPSGGEIFIGGDATINAPYRPLGALTLMAALLDAGPDEARAWAQDLLERHQLTEDGFLLLAALAEARAPAPSPLPATASTWYVAGGSRTLHARSAWSPDASWLVTRCMPGSAVGDHLFFDAGNLVLSRGADHLIVDPSPYGTMSTLTGNAPTVASAVLPPGYAPGQGPWGRPDEVGFAWRRQTQSGVVAARCEYAGQYRFREVPPDVSRAVRDLVLVPHGDGGDATLVLVDHIAGGAGPMRHRLRTLASLTTGGDGRATGTVGASRLTIQLGAGGVTPVVRDLPRGDCFSGQPRGDCDRSRLDGDEWAVAVPGPSARAITIVDASPAAAGEPVVATVTGAGGVDVVGAERGGRWLAVVTATTPSSGPGGPALTYRTRGGLAATHVVVDAPRGRGGRSDVSARADGGECEVTVTARDSGGGLDGEPLVLRLDAGCAVTEDPARDPFVAPTGSDPAPGDPGEAGGCCGAGAAPGSVVLTALLAPLLGRRRRRRVGAAGAGAPA
ncbi:MAG: hypothetical protein KJZ91_12850 [Myxococcales bacterium]|nr:hypothetical protein [Myxococcales bacterium]